jgi:hypothetical protein
LPAWLPWRRQRVPSGGREPLTGAEQAAEGPGGPGLEGGSPRSAAEPSAPARAVSLSEAAGEDASGAVPLSELAQDAGFARQLKVRQQAFTESVGDRVLTLFRISVLSTVILCFALVVLDGWFIVEGWIEPNQRLVTEKVLMAIIGASIVQVGAASSAIVYSLFKQSQAENGSP